MSEHVHISKSDFSTPPDSNMMYGIKNCDTIKKARRWLEDHQIVYQFHDYRTNGLDALLLQRFIDQLGWEALLNTRGTTCRKLSESERHAINNTESAKQLMLLQPAIIKRPLLVTTRGQWILGFSSKNYQQINQQG